MLNYTDNTAERAVAKHWRLLSSNATMGLCFNSCFYSSTELRYASTIDHFYVRRDSRPKIQRPTHDTTAPLLPSPPVPFFLPPGRSATLQVLLYHPPLNHASPPPTRTLWYLRRESSIKPGQLAVALPCRSPLRGDAPNKPDACPRFEVRPSKYRTAYCCMYNVVRYALTKAHVGVVATQDTTMPPPALPLTTAVEGQVLQPHTHNLHPRAATAEARFLQQAQSDKVQEHRLVATPQNDEHHTDPTAYSRTKSGARGGRRLVPTAANQRLFISPPSAHVSSSSARLSPPNPPMLLDKTQAEISK